MTNTSSHKLEDEKQEKGPKKMQQKQMLMQKVGTH